VLDVYICTIDNGARFSVAGVLCLCLSFVLVCVVVVVAVAVVVVVVVLSTYATFI